MSASLSFSKINRVFTAKLHESFSAILSHGYTNQIKESELIVRSIAQDNLELE